MDVKVIELQSAWDKKDEECSLHIYSLMETNDMHLWG